MVAAKQIRAFSLIQNSVLATLFTIIGKGVGFVATLYVAKILGADISTDIAFFAFNLVGLMSCLVQTFNSSILIPQCIGLVEKEGMESARALLSVFATRITLALTFLSVIAVTFRIELLSYVSQFPVEILRQNTWTLYLIIPILPIIYLNDLMVHWIQLQKNFLITNLSFCFHGLSTLFCVGFGAKDFGAASLAMAFLLSAIMQLIWLVFNLVRSKTMVYWQWRSKTDLLIIKQLWHNVLWLQSIGILSSWSIDYFASGLPVGDLTAYSYGRRVFDLLPTLLIAPLVASLYPKLCELAARADKETVGTKLQEMNHLLTALILPISIFTCWHAQEIIEFLYFRGNFSRVAVENASITLKILSPIAWLLATNSLFTHAMFSLQSQTAYKFLVIRSASNLAIQSSFILLLTPLYALKGLVVSISISQILLQPIWNFYLANKFFGTPHFWDNLIFFLKVASSALMMTVLLAATEIHFLSQFVLASGILVCAHWVLNTKIAQLIKSQIVKL